MRVQAVVLNWRDTERTLRCVSSLEAIPGIERIVVVDNESDGALGGVLDPSVTLVPVAENRGFAGGVNLGLEACLRDGADAVLVINNDATLDAVSFELLREALLTDPELGLVAPSIRVPGGGVEPSSGFVVPLLGTTDHRPRPGRAPDFVTWACVLVRRTTLERVGLLDESFFMYWEDVDFCMRMTGAGLRFAEVPTANAVHEVSANRAAHSTAIKAYHTWSARVFARKHAGAWRVGRLAWLATSGAANLLRGRREALDGLRIGMSLAAGANDPAWQSQLRQERFVAHKPAAEEAR